MHDLIGTIVFAATFVFTVVTIKGLVMQHMRARAVRDDALERLAAVEAELAKQDGAASVHKRVSDLENKVLGLQAKKAMGR